MPGYYFTDFGNVTETQYRHWLSVVPAERAAIASAYRFQKDSLLSLAAYLLLEYALKRNGAKRNDGEQAAGGRRQAAAETNNSQNNDEIIFYHNRYGKPYLSPLLAQGGAPFFSLSHADGIAACYLAEKEVGIDVEHIITSGEKIVPTICSPEEQLFFENVGFSDEHLTRLWVLKESCLKSIGAGLSIEPCRLDFSRYVNFEGNETTFSAKLLSLDFSFHLCSLTPGTLAAVCLQGSPEEVQWTRLDVNELQSPFMSGQQASRSNR